MSAVAIGWRARKSAIARATGPGSCRCRLLDVRERRAEELVDLEPQRLSLGTEDGESGLPDRRRLLGRERPLGEGRQLDAEEGVGVGECLSDRVGDALFEQRAARGPVEAADGAHEHRQRARMVAAGVGVEGRRCLPEERLPARQREQREFQQEQAVDAVRMVERELDGDGGAAGVAGRMDALDAERVEERRSVGGVVGDGHGRRRVRAAAPAALVVPDQPEARDQRRLGDERQEAVGEYGTDEQDRLAGSGHLVLELDAVDLYALHVPPPQVDSKKMREHGCYGGNARGYLR